jgi:hypothetical protein
VVISVSMIGGAEAAATIIAMMVVMQSITMIVVIQRYHKGDRACAPEMKSNGL